MTQRVAALRDGLSFVTDFADQAVILPVLAVVVAVLFMQRRWRLGATWVLAVGSVLGAVLVLKIALYACGWLLPLFGDQRLALQSPSGHTASAAVEYGGLVALVAARSRLGSRRAIWVAAMAALAFAVIIGLTRLGLGAHSLSEVLVAGVIGFVGAIAFAKLAGPSIAEKPAYPALAGGLFIIVLFHGRHLPVEPVLQSRAAEMVRHYISACQVN